MTRIPFAKAVLTALLAVLPACSKSTDQAKAVPSVVPDTNTKSEARAVPPRSRPSHANGDAPGKARADVTVTPPAAWTKTDKPGPMRLASYVVPRAPGDPEDGDLSVSEAGGSVDDNIARWARQFGLGPHDAKHTKRTVNGLQVTLVELHGDFVGMSRPGTPAPEKKPGWALRAAIVESHPLTFVKLTGPAKTVDAASAAFDEMIGSITHG